MTTNTNELIELYSVVLPELLKTHAGELTTSDQREELSRQAMKMARAARDVANDIRTGPNTYYTPNTGWMSIGTRSTISDPILATSSAAFYSYPNPMTVEVQGMNSADVAAYMERYKEGVIGTIGKAANPIKRYGKPGRPGITYTPSEAAKLLGTTRRAVIWLIESGQLVSRTTGAGRKTRHKITKTALQKFLRSKVGKERFPGVTV